MDIQKTLLAFEAELLQAERYTPLEGWHLELPNKAAVYAIWEDNVPVYVGETSGLRNRMSGLSRPVNHTFARKVASQLEAKDIKQLREHLRSTYQVSFILVEFGRKEVEEFLILRWKKSLVNKPPKRLINGNQYVWIDDFPAVHFTNS